MKLTREDVFRAIERLRKSKPPEKIYYVFGPKELRLAGKPIEEIIEDYSYDSRVVVVEPQSGKMWCQGKPYVKEERNNAERVDKC